MLRAIALGVRPACVGGAAAAAAVRGGRARARCVVALARRGCVTSPVGAQRVAREHGFGGGRRAERDGWGHQRLPQLASASAGSSTPLERLFALALRGL